MYTDSKRRMRRGAAAGGRAAGRNKRLRKRNALRRELAAGVSPQRAAEIEAAIALSREKDKASR